MLKSKTGTWGDIHACSNFSNVTWRRLLQYVSIQLDKEGRGANETKPQIQSESRCSLSSIYSSDSSINSDVTAYQQSELPFFASGGVTCMPSGIPTPTFSHFENAGGSCTGISLSYADISIHILCMSRLRCGSDVQLWHHVSNLGIRQALKECLVNNYNKESKH